MPNLWYGTQYCCGLAVRGEIGDKLNGFGVARIFTLALFCIFAGPTLIAVQMALDEDAKFWIGRTGLLALFVPVYITILFFVHCKSLEEGTASVRIFWWTMLPPALLLLVLGMEYMITAQFLYGQLKSRDCSAGGALPEKHMLQEAYVFSAGIYEQCLQRMKDERGGVDLLPSERPTLMACDEWIAHENLAWVKPWRSYKKQQARQKTLRRELDYLASVEANHLCGGFCEVGDQLFSDEGVPTDGGRCTHYVAHKFLVIHDEGKTVFFLGFALAWLCVGLGTGMAKTLHTMGYST